MRARWHALHEQFRHKMQRHITYKTFRRMRSRQGALSPFADPVALIDWLHGETRDAERKNGVLAALVTEAQGAEAEIASGLLTLALWPGLDAVDRRRLRHFAGEPDALASKITARLVTGIRGMDLDRVSKVAATIIRDIGRALERARRESGRSSSLDTLDERDAIEAGEAQIPAERRIAARQDLTATVAALGADASLVLDIAGRRLSQRTAAEAQGLGHEAGRKRYQRAIQSLRASEVRS